MVLLSIFFSFPIDLSILLKTWLIISSFSSTVYPASIAAFCSEPLILSGLNASMWPFLFITLVKIITPLFDIMDLTEYLISDSDSLFFIIFDRKPKV